MKKLFNKRSKVLGVTCLLESIISISLLIYFNHFDRLMYAESGSDINSLVVLVRDMYTSTWWALIILVFCLITIFSVITFIYRDLKFHIISLMLYVILVILAIDFNDSFMNNLSVFFIFIPLIVINIIAYKYQKKLS